MLEGVSDERRLLGLRLHALPHYRGITDALGLIMAQLAAFAAAAGVVLQQQDAARHVPKRPWLRTASASRQATHHSRLQPPSAQTLAQAMRSAAAGSSPDAEDCSAAAVAAATAPAGDQPPAGFDAASVGFSTLLSGAERQPGGGGGSSLAGKAPWTVEPRLGQARELLRREMDAGIGYYWWCVRQASAAVPVQVPRSREVMVLLFLLPVCNGLLEAAERLQVSARDVLQPKAALSGLWGSPLLRLLLVQSPLRALHALFTQQLPACLGSRAGFVRALGSRQVQANLKLLFLSCSALVATLLLMSLVPVVRMVVPIFGFAAVALCFSERLEATVQKVRTRGESLA